MAKVIRAIKPNAGIRAKYRKRLVSLLDEMQRSVVWWLRAEYRKQETRIAQDASPASDLQDRLKRPVPVLDEAVEGKRGEFCTGVRGQYEAAHGSRDEAGPQRCGLHGEDGGKQGHERRGAGPL